MCGVKSIPDGRGMTHDGNHHGTSVWTQYGDPSSPGYWTNPPALGYPIPGSVVDQRPGPVALDPSNAAAYGYPAYPPASASTPAPGYPPLYLPYGGYPPYGATYPAGPRRPGAVTAAAVLAFVQSGFVLIGGLMTVSGASAMAAFHDVGWTSAGDFRGELALVGIVTLVVGALLIAGGVRIFSGPPGLLTIGGLLSIALSLYWGIRLSGLVGTSVESAGLRALLVYPVLFVILPIIAVSLAHGSAAKGWATFRAAGGR